MTLEDARILAAHYTKHRPRTKQEQRLALCRMLLARATMQRYLPVPYYPHLFEYFFRLGAQQADRLATFHLTLSRNSNTGGNDV